MASIPAILFVVFVVIVGPLPAFQVLGFGAGIGLALVAMAIWAFRSPRSSVLVPLLASYGFLGLVLLSYLFTRDIQGSLIKFAGLKDYVLTTGAFLVVLYSTIGCFAALAISPVWPGLRAREQVCYRYVFIYVSILALSVVYLYPAVFATGLLASAQAPGPRFAQFWEAHFFHTPWLLAWQVASWLVILVLVRLTVDRAALRRYASSEPHIKLQPELVGAFVAMLALGSAAEAFRGFWYTWGATALLLILIALNLQMIWSPRA